MCRSLNITSCIIELTQSEDIGDHVDGLIKVNIVQGEMASLKVSKNQFRLFMYTVTTDPFDLLLALMFQSIIV